ncbi:MAG: hybrid sensor histidine kinase/response regulator [Labilibaculum sp.]|nr:hybrid sensor histidine kinase/response regulator [Labilibaculum sp.]MBI9058922.1 hybrid sensor histidine kinase/response regulator [Labilibaculum sp.]
MNTNMKIDIKGHTPTVLVVDDNPNNLKIVALTLRELNFKIVIATNGKSAIDLVERTKPDLVLLDIMMPEMDGFQVCEIIKSKEEHKNLPIIFLTAVGEKSKIVKGFELGGVDYITKPFNKEELIIRIKTHLELKFTRDELQETSDHLADLNSLKDKMFSIIGHDLRSPLGNIQMTLDLLSKGIFEHDSDDYKETMQTLVECSDEVSNLLENLLGWAKSQSGNLKMQPEQINVANLVESSFYLFKRNLSLKNISFESQVSDNIEISADMYLTKTILRNLISNALKFTAEGGKIIVQCKLNEEHIHLSVVDTGIGITEEDQTKLFDAKEHISTYGTNGETGRGIGLKVAGSFAEKMEGKITVESQIDNGSTFTLDLPITKN